jgi:hypothetical protein
MAHWMASFNRESLVEDELLHPGLEVKYSSTQGCHVSTTAAIPVNGEQ